MLNITDRAISKWENGICLPDASTMPLLCEILGITINDMWFDIEQVHTDNADGILCCSFDLEIIEEIETSQTEEYMEELKTKLY